jgi:hypothetical protein
LTIGDVSTCIAHLPAPGDVAIGRIILSGGEVLVWPELLLHTLSSLHDRYGDRTQLMVQTNGDLLDDAMLDRILSAHVQRIDVSGMDQYHPKSTLRRREQLEALFATRGMREASTLAATAGQDSGPGAPIVYAFWGATEDQWIGPLWPRGRARKLHLSKAKPETDFCGQWSGAKGFLDYRADHSEVNVQLSDVYPCCPMTCRPIGNLAAEPLIDILDRCARHPVYRALNEGRPEKMGEYLGISEEEGRRRTRALGNHCLWCDEFFTLHAPELLNRGGITERGRSDLDA